MKINDDFDQITVEEYYDNSPPETYYGISKEEYDETERFRHELDFDQEICPVCEGIKPFVTTCKRCESTGWIDIHE